MFVNGVFVSFIIYMGVIFNYYGMNNLPLLNYLLLELTGVIIGFFLMFHHYSLKNVFSPIHKALIVLRISLLIVLMINNTEFPIAIIGVNQFYFGLNIFLCYWINSKLIHEIYVQLLLFVIDTREKYCLKLNNLRNDWVLAYSDYKTKIDLIDNEWGSHVRIQECVEFFYFEILIYILLLIIFFLSGKLGNTQWYWVSFYVYQNILCCGSELILIKKCNKKYQIV